MVDQSTPTPIAKIPVAERSVAAKLQRGTIVGKYRLGETLARGSFGTVWRAVRIADSLPVAIKFLHPFLCESREAIGRLEREAKAISAVRHPNVVGVHELGRLVDGRPYIVMDLLEGTNLFAKLQKEGAFSAAQTLAILDGVCAALTAAHSVGIIHRDIKASNTFLVRGDKVVRAVLLDFGLAKILEGEGPELSSSRATLGTPSAMAPEQIRSEPVTPRTDIYALGALAYHLLTGEPAFYGTSRTSIFNMHLHGKRPRPSQRADVPLALDKVVIKSMAREPSKRHANAMAFLAEFASAAKSDTDLFRRKTKPSRPQRVLGAYLDIQAPIEILADPSDDLLEELEAIETVAEGILGAANLDIAARRGNSILFTKEVPVEAALIEQRQLLSVLDVVKTALDTRESLSGLLSIRLGADIVAGRDSAEQLLLEALTRETNDAGDRPGIVATPRFFSKLYNDETNPLDAHRVAHDSELE